MPRICLEKRLLNVTLQTTVHRHAYYNAYRDEVYFETLLETGNENVSFWLSIPEATAFVDQLREALRHAESCVLTEPLEL